MKKYIALFMAVCIVAVGSCAWADWMLNTVHRSITDFVNGKPDYTNARFLGMWSAAANYNAQATQEDVNLTGTMTFSGGNYSFWNGRNGGMLTNSGTQRTFGLTAAMNVGDGLMYMPTTASGDQTIFCLSADNGLNGVNVSWNFPDKPSYNRQATFPDYMTTQEQLESYVPYVEYISSGTQVTGLRWRVVSPDNTSEAVTLDFASSFIVADIWNTSGNHLYSGGWATIEAGNPVSGDGNITAINYKIVTSSDTSTALTPSYRTDFRIEYYRINPDPVEGERYRSSWINNTASGTWTLGKPQPLSNIEKIAVRYQTWEDPSNSRLYIWNFYPAEAPAPATLEITTATLPAATLNAPYTATLAANLTGVTWSLSSGTLPTGLTLNSSTSAITGTPTTAGTSTFTVKAEKNSQSAEKQLSITVSAIPSITITTTSLNSGTVGTAYSATLAASITGVNWSVINGTLPAGLSLNPSSGVISGTPTTAGTSTFTVRAVYGSANDEKQFTLTINKRDCTMNCVRGKYTGGKHNGRSQTGKTQD